MDREFPAVKKDNHSKMFNVTDISDIMKRKSELKSENKANNAINNALDIKNKNERVKIAKEIIKMFPDCVEAYFLLARDDTENLFDVKNYYEKAVLAAEHLMKVVSGDFIGDVDEKAKYMVAKYSLSNVLWEIGERNKAVSCLTELLSEDGNDDIGARYVLVTWLIELQRDSTCEKIFKKFKFDHSANFVYSHALFLFKNNRNFEAVKALNEALKNNIIIPQYILGFRKIDNDVPDTVYNEKENEAVTYSWDNYRVWHVVDGACMWLKNEYDKQIKNV